MKRYIVNGWKDIDITDKLKPFGEVEKISELHNIYLLITNAELGDILDIGWVASARLEDDTYLTFIT
jgi:hypothetical protein